MSNQDIVITGVGAVASNGLDYEEFVNNCLDGKSGIRISKRMDTSDLKGHYIGEIDYDALEERIKCSDAYDKTTYLAYCATLESLKQAGITPDYLKGKNVAVVVGSLFGGYNSLFEIQKTFLSDIHLEEVPCKVFEYFFPCAVSDFLCTKFGIEGPRIIVSNACASGGSAVGLAYDLIKSGTVDMAIAGGTDELNNLCLAGFNSLGAISKDVCAPYVKSQGINIGEGAGMFVLEKEKVAEARNAKIKAKILGYYLNSDAYHITTPNPKGEGAYTLMKTVVEMNNITHTDIDFINGHGTGTMANDTAEIRAINKLFEGTEYKVKLTSTKANVGHCMGAAGAVELAATVGSIEKKMVTPLYGTGEKETPNVQVVLENKPVEKPVALSNSFAFGGNNVSLAVSSADYECKAGSYESAPVVITGVDCIGNYHSSYSEFKNMLLKPPVEFFGDKEYEGKCACCYKGTVPDVNYKQFMPPDALRRTDNITKFAVVTSARAIADANIAITNDNSNAIGHVYASGIGPITTIRDLNTGIIERGLGKMNPFFFPNSVYNAAPGYVTMNSRIKGATITINAGSSSLACCMIYAKILINSKKAEKVVVTLADDYNEIYHYAYDHFGVLSTKGDTNTFTNEENTVVLSTGSVSFVVESKEAADRRGQRIYAELHDGVICGSENKSGIFSPTFENYSETLTAAVQKAGLTWSDIDLYCSPCAGIAKNDKIEKELIWDTLSQNVNISSIKPYCGFNVSIQSAYSLASALVAFESNCANVVRDGKLEKIEKVFKSAVIGSYAFGNTVGGIVVTKPKD